MFDQKLQAKKENEWCFDFQFEFYPYHDKKIKFYDEINLFYVCDQSI